MNDLISRSALMKEVENAFSQFGLKKDLSNDTIQLYDKFTELVLFAPTVTPDMAQVLAYECGKASERPLEDEWIPIVTRPLTEEEKEKYPDSDFIYDCPLPDDGEEVLVTTSCDDVALDVFCRDGDYGCYFENYCDEGDVVAWQSKPKPYKGADNKNNIPLPPTTGSDAYK